MADRDLAHLHPLMRAKWDELCARVADRLGLHLDFLEGYRGGAAQAAVKASGASNARAGQSWHNVELADGTPAALAAHFDPFPGGSVLGFGSKVLEWPGARKVLIDFGSGHPRPCTAAILIYTAVGLLAEELGLVWGGRWDRLQDYQHVELRPNGATLMQVTEAMRVGADLTRLQRSATA